MTVIPLNERPVWIPACELGTNRFDSSYYDPVLCVAERQMRSGAPLEWKRLSDVAKDLYSFGAYELTTQIKFVLASPTTVPFINIGEVVNPFVDIASCRHIDLASHHLLSKSRCSAGTLLLSMTATIGGVGIVPYNVGECNSNQHLAKAVIDESISDPHFLAAYFCGRVGQASLFREAAGAVQKALYLYNILTLPVPAPKKPIRTAIGHKVRAADVLRATAASQISNAESRIESLLGKAADVELKPNPDGACDYFSGFILLSELGLFHGAQFYAPKRKRAVSLVQATGIGERIGNHGHRVRSKGKQQATREHVDPGNVSGSDGYWYSGGSEDGGDVVLAKPGHALFLRMRPYLNKTTINDTDREVSGSPELLVYEFDGLDAYYATLCLRQPWALAQVAEIATGDRPRVDGEFVDEIVVPWPEERIRHEIGQLNRSNFALRRRADELVKQAILDVERLINGELDEDQCLAEGAALAKEFDLEML